MIVGWSGDAVTGQARGFLRRPNGEVTTIDVPGAQLTAPSRVNNRGTFDPAYLNYTIVKLMIRKLRDDWTASRGGRGAWKQFHDQFLSYGGPPIPLVRKTMMGASETGQLF